MDGTGKSTMARTIKEHLESKGRKVLLIEHPDKNKISGRIESGFLQSDCGKLSKLMTTVAFIADVLGSLTLKWLKESEYDDFVFVRYIMSVAYLPDSVAFKAYNVISCILPMPETRILAHVDVETAIKRIESRGDEHEIFENNEDLKRTGNLMIELSRDSWIVVDNTDSPEKVRTELIEIVERNIN